MLKDLIAGGYKYLKILKLHFLSQEPLAIITTRAEICSASGHAYRGNKSGGK